MKATIKIILRAAAATLFAAAIAPCALGRQEVPDDFEQNECERVSGSATRRCERETADSVPGAQILTVMATRSPRGPEPKLAVTQIREDFARLQAANSRLSLVAAQGGELDFKAVAQSASEISKRADRLRDSLALPDSAVDAEQRPAEVVAEAARLRSALSALSALVRGAVRNPMFREYKFDAALAARARRDLDEIVELSGGIKKSSEQLIKAAR